MGARRVGERLAWMGAAASGAVAATQVARRTPTPMVAIGQALTPVLVVAAPAAATIGLLRRRPALVLTAATSTAVLAATVAPAMRRPPEHAAIRTEADVLPMTIAHANMLYMNHRHARQAAAAVAANDADVLALSEITPRQARELDDLAGDRYEHRFSRPAVDSHGLALWSKLPLDDVTIQPMIRRPGIIATIVAPFGRVRLVFAHPDPPTKWRWFRQWEPSLEMIDELGSSPGDPTIIVADLNATRWHPGLRRLLNGRWSDAHEALGRGLSTSWPTLGFVPAFVRLDHALVDERLQVLDVIDFVVAGSDHRGFVVAIAPR